MPVKGSKLRYGNRDYIFNKEFYKANLVEKRNVKLTFNQCKELLDLCNKSIAEVIINENDGFKLPFGLGYICVSKYKPTRNLINWKKTNENGGKHVHHLNLHTLGFAVKINWFRAARLYHSNFHETYKFVRYKNLSKAVSLAFGAGKVSYSEWNIYDFIEKGRAQNLLNKKYKTLKE